MSNGSINLSVKLLIVGTSENKPQVELLALVTWLGLNKTLKLNQVETDLFITHLIIKIFVLRNVTVNFQISKISTILNILYFI